MIKIQKDQVGIQKALNKPLAPSMAAVCQASGILPNAKKNSSERSVCRKKLEQEDDQGLNDDERAAVEVALGLN